MELAVFLGLLAFLLTLGMIALLAMSSRKDRRDDPITEAVIVRATTETIAVIEMPTSPEDDARESTPNKDRDHETPSANSE